MQIHDVTSEMRVYGKMHSHDELVERTPTSFRGYPTRSSNTASEGQCDLLVKQRT